MNHFTKTMAVILVVMTTIALSQNLEERVKVHKLKNGLTVIFVERHGSPTFSAIYGYKVGAVDEVSGITGVAHLFEHMAFKGTPKIGTTDFAKETPIMEEGNRVGRELSLELLKGDAADKEKIKFLGEQLEKLDKDQKQYTNEELEKVVMEHLENLKRTPVSDTDLQKVKNNLEASYIRAMRSNMGLAMTLTHYQLLFGDWKTFLKVKDMVNSVGAQDVMDCAKKYFSPENKTVAYLLKKSNASAQIHPRDLPEPAELSFKPPKPVEFTLSNGIHVFYLEDSELPLISLNAVFKGGSLYEEREKAGLSSLTRTVLRTGGTKTLTGDEIDAELEFLAASVEAGIGTEYANVSANCLKKDFKRVLEVFADVIQNPEFRQDKIDLAKNQLKESIRRRWDIPTSVASTLFIEKLYGGTPYARRATYKSLNNVTREDMIAFHNQYFAPNNMYLAIVGDIPQDEARSMLENAFEGWKKKNVKIPKIAELVERSDGTVFYVPRETPQASVVMGHLGVRRNNPDERKIEVMNDIFGGGNFTARLMKEIRSNRGLTYGIYGGVFSGKDRGMFRIGSQLKAEKCVEALSLIKDMIREMQDVPVTDEEIALSQRFLINSFVFRFESKDRLASEYMSLKLDGYPDNYFDAYIDNIKKVTKRDVQDVSKKYMDPSKMIILVVGDEKNFDKPLSALGKVEEIDYKKIAESEKSEK